jgi:RNA polymerase sigma factor (sigma-70 family)
MKYDTNLTVGDVTVLVSLLGKMYMPVNSLLNFSVDWIRSMSLFSRIFDYFDMEVEIKNDENPIILDDPKGSITFNHVNFHYNEERKILKVALSKLSLREKQIMNMRFGLDGEEEFTQKEVADILGISQSYISRLEKKIVERLKKEFKKYS